MKNKRIVVTGGAGFIGSHITDLLIEKGCEVAIIDNLSTGQKENLNPKAKLYEIDITDFSKTREVFEKENPQVVFHLAAQMNVRKSVEDPMFDAKTNILGSINLINLALEKGIEKFIFSSTGGAIYGDTESRPTLETENEWPLSPYGVAKLAVDKFLNYAHQIHGLKYTSLRYGNVYGPRQNPHGEAGVMAIFLNKMLSGDTPVINGDGLQTRDYVYVADIARANLSALENMNKVGVYNVGTGVETDVVQLFNGINAHFGGKFEEKHGPAKLGEQKTSCLSWAKIEKELGWKPTVNFKDGVELTYRWFREKINNPLPHQINPANIRTNIPNSL